MSTSYRRKALEEHGEECLNCGVADGIEVHHLDGDRTNNGLDNLIPLCRTCHSRLHRSGLNGLEEQLLPVEDRPQLDPTTTTFQIQVSECLWRGWKDTVPRRKSLETRIIELIEADTEGRVVDQGVNIGGAYQALNRALDELPEGAPGRTAVEDAKQLLEELEDDGPGENNA